MFTGCTSSIPQSKFNGESIDPAILVTDFTLFGADGSEWNWKQNSEGKVMVVVFLFTNCLDVCPVVTQNLKWIQESLSEKELTEVGFATITVDPWRDNNETLKQWMINIYIQLIGREESEDIIIYQHLMKQKVGK